MRYLVIILFMIAPACESVKSGAAETEGQRAAMSKTAPTADGASAARADMMAAGLTKAPQRVVVRARLNESLDKVWDYVSNHDNLVEYSNGLLQSADVDRSGSNGTNGVGAKRTCTIGKDRFVENVVFYEAPYVFAYSAIENTWGLEGHLASVSLTPDGESTLLEWTLFFNTADPSMAPMMAKNMDGMMRGKMLPFFTKKFGGEVLPPPGPTAEGARGARADMMAAGFTKAPERVAVRARLNSSIDKVWDYVSNHDNLVEYSNGLLQSADVDRSGSNGTNGVGAKRTCTIGKDRFVEKVVFYEAPYVFAYTATENTWGLEGHLASVSLTPDGDSTLIEWTLFFNTADPSMAPMMSKNMEGMMRGKMLPFFTEKFGGELLPPS